MSENKEFIKSDSTRRDYLKYGATIISTGFITGCLDSNNSDPNTSKNNESVDRTKSPKKDSYTVLMAPMGEVTFDSVPETWVPYSGDYADMAVALGHSDGITGIGSADRYYTYVYDELPGISINKNTIDQYSKVRNKEQFYALDSDVHFYDPQMLINWFDWERSDIQEVSDNVGPFFGNLIFRRSDEWHDYRYYTLYEVFEKIAEVFQEKEIYQAFKEFHDEFISKIQKRLPPEGERPNVMLTFEGTDTPETFSPYRLNDRGTSKKQWNDLGVDDALAETGIENLSTENRGELDYENLLEVNPDVLLVRGHERKSASEFRNTVLEYMKNR